MCAFDVFGAANQSTIYRQKLRYGGALPSRTRAVACHLTEQGLIPGPNGAISPAVNGEFNERT
jgi:hypothetical protein